MRNNHGFTLIEVLITVVVLSIGLLGLAGMQATSLKHNQTAYFRSQATQLAYDLADRVRANVDDAESGAASTYNTSGASKHTKCATTAGCTPIEMAENDLYEWDVALKATLPGNNATGTITYNDPQFNIVISWDDNRDGLLNNTDASFQTDFQL